MKIKTQSATDKHDWLDKYIEPETAQNKIMKNIIEKNIAMDKVSFKVSHNV